jgi:hypothetical protein
VQLREIPGWLVSQVESLDTGRQESPRYAAGRGGGRSCRIADLSSPQARNDSGRRTQAARLFFPRNGMSLNAKPAILATRRHDRYQRSQVTRNDEPGLGKSRS